MNAWSTILRITHHPQNTNTAMKTPSATAAISILSLLMATSPSTAFSSSESQPPSQKEPLQLPPCDPNNDNIPSLQFGQSLKLEHLGPIIINTDGTMRRIDNWETLTESEREVSWRRIKKRNAERREILEAKEREMIEQQEQNKQDSEWLLNYLSWSSWWSHIGKKLTLPTYKNV